MLPNHNSVDKLYSDCGGPYFLYELENLKEHLLGIKNSLPKNVNLWYACKANPLSSILEVILDAGWNLDIASSGELEQGLGAGFPSSNILATGPAKSKIYLEKLLDNGIRTFVLESQNQAIWLLELAKQRNIINELTTLIRLQLDWQGGSSVLGGNEITPFGLEITGWQDVKDVLQELNVSGIHVFQWGNILDEEELFSIWKRIFNTANEVKQLLCLDIEIIDLGGGLGLNYLSDQSSLDLNIINKKLEDLNTAYNFSNQQIWMELGRYAVGEFGKYYSKIVDIKSVRGKDLIILESGINHLARPTLTNEPFPMRLISCHDKSDQQVSYTLHGPLCTALDCLGDVSFDKVASIGDYIEFSMVGAYGFTESMPYFLCHDLPCEVTIFDNKTKIIRRKESAKQWCK